MRSGTYLMPWIGLAQHSPREEIKMKNCLLKPISQTEAISLHIIFESGSIWASAKHFSISYETARNTVLRYCLWKFPKETRKALGGRDHFDAPSLERLGVEVAKMEFER